MPQVIRDDRRSVQPHKDKKAIEPSFQLRKVLTSPVNTIMVKFTVNKRSMVPEGITERDRGTDKQAEVRQQFAALSAGKNNLKVGTVRPGRFDSGEQRIAIEGAPTNVDFLRRNLTSSGFRLTKVQFYEKEGKGKYDKVKFVVECVFTRIPEELEPFDTTKIDRALRQLATTPFSNCYVWVNPNGVCTVNLTSRAPDAKAVGSLKVVDGELKFVKNCSNP